MPTTKSAKKRLRQNEKIRTRNRAAKSTLKTQVRKVREAAAAKNVTEGEAELRLTAKKLDQAASRNIIHRNKAARTKSRLQKLLKSTKQLAKV